MLKHSLHARKLCARNIGQRHGGRGALGAGWSRECGVGLEKVGRRWLLYIRWSALVHGTHVQSVFRDTGLCHGHVEWDVSGKVVRATRVKAGTAA